MSYQTFLFHLQDDMHVEDTPLKLITIMRETKVKMYF